MTDTADLPGMLPRDGSVNTPVRARLRVPDASTLPVLACFACGWWCYDQKVGPLSPRSTCPNCRDHGSKPITLASADLTLTRKVPS